MIDPAALAGADVYHSRLEALIDAMCADPEVRLPGERRARLAQQASREGVEIPDALYARVVQLAARGEPDMNGIILLAHGSRDPQWTASFEQVRAAVERRLPECATALAYLEHSVPDFATAVDQLVARGTTLIEVVPLFLGAGGHVRNDVPHLVERAAAHARRVLLKPFIGDAAVLDAIADYAAAKPATSR